MAWSEKPAASGTDRSSSYTYVSESSILNLKTRLSSWMYKSVSFTNAPEEADDGPNVSALNNTFFYPQGMPTNGGSNRFGTRRPESGFVYPR